MGADGDALARLGRELTACGVVAPAQWGEAAARAGSDDPRDVLNILSRARAHWAPEVDRGPVPALTAYQIAQLEGWLAAPRGPFPADRLVWNSYLLLDRLAEGGMGVVFKGWCPHHRRYVAIKRTLGDSGERRRRLRREAELLRRLRHPAVAEFYAREALGTDDLLVMEFVPGKTLLDVARDRAAKGSPVPWVSVAEWAVELLGALDHLSGRNPAGVVMVHRDVKPSNVMLRPDAGRYRAVLVDFGLARSEGGDGDGPEGDQLTSRYEFLGTPEYAAPEQWNGGRFAVPASDVYALGGTLFFALTARPPFGTLPAGAANQIAALMQMMSRHRSGARPQLRTDRPDVPPELERLILRMLALDAADRGSPAELQARFAALVSGTGSTAPLPTLPPPPPAVPPPAPPRPAERPTPLAVRADKPVRPAPAPAPAVVPPPPPAPTAPVLGPDTATYRLQDPSPPPAPSGSKSGSKSRSGSGRKKRTPVVGHPALPADVEAAEPPTPATADVFATFVAWAAARSGGQRRAVAPWLWGEFRRQIGAWLRAYARPLAHPGRWLFLLGAVALVGVTAGWEWSFVPLAVVGLAVVFAHLAEEE